MRRFFRRLSASLFPLVTATGLIEAARQGWSLDDRGLYCRNCGASVGAVAPTGRCSHCPKAKPAWDELIRLDAYRPPISLWIVAMKFHGVWPWATWFGEQLAERAMAAGADHASESSPDGKKLKMDQAESGSAAGAATAPDVVCATPMHWRRRWSRGYNQADLIARAFAKTMDLRFVPLLHRSRFAWPQTHVPPSQRAANVRDTFAMEPVDLAGRHIWLVDDVKTTGATAQVCARLLKKAGASRVTLVVAAVADPKHADFQIT